MITLNDGPAAGSYAVTRAPKYIRAVVGPLGKRKVLDQLTDDPNPTERVYVYVRVDKAGTIRLGVGGRRAVIDQVGTYRWLAVVDGDALRDRQAWRNWAIQHAGGIVNIRTGEYVNLETGEGLEDDDTNQEQG